MGNWFPGSRSPNDDAFVVNSAPVIIAHAISLASLFFHIFFWSSIFPCLADLAL